MHLIFSDCSVVAEHDELLHFVSCSGGPALVKNTVKQCWSTVTIKMCDFKNIVLFTQCF